MKKLSKLKLKEFREMSDFEMKQVLGGSGDFEGGGTGNLEGGGSGVEATSCSTTCSNGSTVAIDNCIGTCSAIDGVSVTCTGSVTGEELTKKCGH
jgi:natural product precursor